MFMRFSNFTRCFLRCWTFNQAFTKFSPLTLRRRDMKNRLKVGIQPLDIAFEVKFGHFAGGSHIRNFQQ